MGMQCKGARETCPIRQRIRSPNRGLLQQGEDPSGPSGAYATSVGYSRSQRAAQLYTPLASQLATFTSHTTNDSAIRSADHEAGRSEERGGAKEPTAVAASGEHYRLEHPLFDPAPGHYASSERTPLHGLGATPCFISMPHPSAGATLPGYIERMEGVEATGRQWNNE